MKTIEYKNHIIKIVQDDCPESPREWDNLGTMYFLHKRYNLGDKHNLDSEDIQAIENDENYISLPVYMYEHSGYTIRTYPFSCSWDSGKLGIIAIHKDKVKKEFGKKRISKKLRAKIIEYLDNEVKTYDDYLTGNCYGYQIEDLTGNQIDSCYGFIGDMDYCLNEAKACL